MSKIETPNRFTRIRLTTFRNYAELDLDLSPGVNAFAGPNGMGKTNLLEAVHYLATSRGFQQDREAVLHGESFFMLEGELENGPEARHRITCSFVPGKPKRVLVDGQPVARMSAFLGRIPVVTLLPDDTDLVRGAPEGRRKWLDMLISQFDPSYLQALIRYDKALAQRNAQLRAFADGLPPDRGLLHLWEAPMAQSGAEILATRRTFLHNFRPVFARYYEQIAAEGEVRSAEEAGLGHETQFETGDEAEWFARFERHLARDLATARTSMGPHRDDVQFLLGGHPARAFGSQGQRKTFLAALKFAQAEYLEVQTGKPPILLLDDLFDKLDAERVRRLTQLVTERFRSQVFATDTSLERLHAAFGVGAEVKYFGVSEGGVRLL